MKKLFALLLAAALLLTAFPVVSLATEVVASGTCSEHLTWTLDDAGTLTISGTGPMDDYYSYAEDVVIRVATPWCNMCANIKRITIGSDVTSIGKYAFAL